jgi:hypothetical protein
VLICVFHRELMKSCQLHQLMQSVVACHCYLWWRRWWWCYLWDSHKVMTALIIILPSRFCCRDFSAILKAYGVIWFCWRCVSVQAVGYLALQDVYILSEWKLNLVSLWTWVVFTFGISFAFFLFLFFAICREKKWERAARQIQWVRMN